MLVSSKCCFSAVKSPAVWNNSSWLTSACSMRAEKGADLCHLSLDRKYSLKCRPGLKGDTL